MSEFHPSIHTSHLFIDDTGLGMTIVTYMWHMDIVLLPDPSAPAWLSRKANQVNSIRFGFPLSNSQKWRRKLIEIKSQVKML